MVIRVVGANITVVSYNKMDKCRNLQSELFSRGKHHMPFEGQIQYSNFTQET